MIYITACVYKPAIYGIRGSNDGGYRLFAFKFARTNAAAFFASLSQVWNFIWHIPVAVRPMI